MARSGLGLGGFIRGMQEARDALAEILAQPERRFQIITIMQKIVICMSRDTRKFLSDAMAGLIEGGLGYMRQKRREAIEDRFKREGKELKAPPPKPPPKKETSEEIAARVRAAREEEERKRRELEESFEAIELVEHVEEETPEIELPPPPGLETPAPAVEEPVAELPPPPEPAPEPEPVPAAAAPEPPPPEPEPAAPPLEPEAEEIRQIEELGTELDALSLADVAREIFPDLKDDYEPWQIGRAIYLDEESVRKALLQGARLKDSDRATMLAPAFDDMKRLIENRQPYWIGSLPSIRECIDAHFAARAPKEGGCTPDQVFDVIAMSDEKATGLLKAIAKSNEPGVAYVGEVRDLLDRLLEIESERA